jgi:hypothetical protein
MNVPKKRCAVDGCLDHTSSFRPWCNRHSLARRNHGHPEQRPIDKTTLRPFTRAIEAKLRAHPEWTGIALAKERWREAMRDQRALHAAYFEGGQAMRRWEVRTAQDLIRVDEGVEVKAILVTIAAMFLMAEDMPRLFRDDRAWRYQLVRMVRKLTSTSLGTVYDHRAGKVRGIYRVRREAEVMAFERVITEVFGGLAMALARAVLKDREREQAARAAMTRAIGEVLA